MSNPRDEAKRLMQRVRKRRAMPSSDRTVSETFTLLGYISCSVLPADVLVSFNVMLRRLYDETLVTLEEYEAQTYAAGIPQEFVSTYPEDVAKSEKVAQEQGFTTGVPHLLTGWYPMLRRAFLSVGQGRMARGGKDFELQIEGLFKLASLPYEKQEKADHTDFMLPDAAFHTKNKTMAVVISVKRTLRERWAEVAEELFNLRIPNVFLFTADEDVTVAHVETICTKYNIHLVVWDAVKTKKFTATPMVLSYTEWASERLPQLRQFWPKP